MAEWEPPTALLDCAERSLAIYWPLRAPSMCQQGMPDEEQRACRAAAREVLIAIHRSELLPC